MSPEDWEMAGLSWPVQRGKHPGKGVYSRGDGFFFQNLPQNRFMPRFVIPAQAGMTAQSEETAGVKFETGSQTGYPAGCRQPVNPVPVFF
jgi:hypothetical protein